MTGGDENQGKEEMIGNAKIVTRWPEMPVHHLSAGLAQTARIDGPTTLTIPNGSKIETVLRIEKTFVRQVPLHPRHYLVDKCRAFTPYEETAIATIEINIPEEPCEVAWDFCDGLHMNVFEVIGTGTVKLADGSSGFASLTLPKTISRWIEKGLWLVDEVLSEGWVSFR